MNLLKQIFIYGGTASLIFLLSCEEETVTVIEEVIVTDTVTVVDTDTVTVVDTDTVLVGFAVPEKYVFLRETNSTVSFGGQTTRLKMAVHFITAMSDNTLTLDKLVGMWAHEEGGEDFPDDITLNSSGKQIKNKTGANTGSEVNSAAIKADIETWVTSQVNDVFPNWANDASSGVAGNIQQAGGGSTRYVNANGLELNQAVNKALIGAFVADQAINGYLTPGKLDGGTNMDDQTAGTTLEGKYYTNMEHYWDEGFGYVYGMAEDATDPVTTPGGDDKFLLKYISKVEGDPDFAGTAPAIFNNFKLGRAALVGGDFVTRDAAAKDVAGAVSKTIAVRAAHYLKAGAVGKAEATPDYASIFHNLSEGYGFVYSLQFTRNPATAEPYFTREQVTEMLAKVYPTSGDKKGFWDVTGAELTEVATEIATAFGFTYDEA